MILTIDELREHITTTLSDDALLALLEATEADILGAVGGTSVTEYLPGGRQRLVLAHPVDSLTSATEAWDRAPLTLAADDYAVDGYMLIRLETGTNPRSTWYGEVKVVYAPLERSAERVRAQVALVRGDMDYQAGVTSERIGDWAQSYASPGASWPEQRALILASLRPIMVA